MELSPTTSPAGVSAARPGAAAADAFVPSLRPLGRAMLRQEAERVLRAEIVVGTIQPGVLYPIARIAEQLQVSITPVRDAVLSLERDGLLEVVRNRGFRVVELSDHDLDELVDLRVLLEAAAVERLARRPALEGEARFRRLAADVERAARRGDLVSFIKLDRDFHLDLIGQAGNRRLVDEVARLRDQTRLPGLGDIAGSETLFRTTREHDHLLDAIVARNAKLARQVITEHVSHARGVWAGRQEPG